MGDVVPLRPPKCTCGWKLPVNIEIHMVGKVITFDDEPLRAAVTFRCPMCNSPIQAGDTGATRIGEEPDG